MHMIKIALKLCETLRIVIYHHVSESDVHDDVL